MTKTKSQYCFIQTRRAIGTHALIDEARIRCGMTDKEMAVQAGVTVAHESGFYVGTWGSNLAGWGTFAGSNMELDIIGGYKTEIGGVTVDVLRHLTLDIGYRYSGIFIKTDYQQLPVPVSPHSHTRIDTHRLFAGAGFRF